MSTSMTAEKSGFKPALWTPGDWNAFFGFGTNILVNMLVLTGLLRFVLKMPDSLVFGRILTRGEPGWEIIPELAPLPGEIVIDKPGKGAFYATELGDILQKYGIENLLVCGVTTEVCVNTTVREANDRGYRCVVLADGCASYFPEFHDMGLKMIKAQGGIFGWVSDSAAVLEAMTPETSNNQAAGISR